MTDDGSARSRGWEGSRSDAEAFDGRFPTFTKTRAPKGTDVAELVAAILKAKDAFRELGQRPVDTTKRNKEEDMYYNRTEWVLGEEGELEKVELGEGTWAATTVTEKFGGETYVTEITVESTDGSRTVDGVVWALMPLEEILAAALETEEPAPVAEPRSTQPIKLSEFTGVKDWLD